MHPSTSVVSGDDVTIVSRTNARAGDGASKHGKSIGDARVGLLLGHDTLEVPAVALICDAPVCADRRRLALRQTA